MDPTHQTPHAHTIPLVELFETQSDAPVHETCAAVCHGFEIYTARNDMVRETAYLLAEARGFEPGRELEDWLTAERDADGRLFAEIAPVGFVG
jgi:hypothetical protein